MAKFTMARPRSGVVAQNLYVVTFMKNGKERDVRVQAASPKIARNLVLAIEKPEAIKRMRKS